MADIDKMAIMAWLHMAVKGTDIGVYTKNRKNVDKFRGEKCPNFNLGILKTEGGSLFFKNV